MASNSNTSNIPPLHPSLPLTSSENGLAADERRLIPRKSDVWSENSFRLTIAFGVIGSLLFYILNQSSLFKIAPVGMQACLVAEAIATISLFYIPTFQGAKLAPVLKYISALNGSIWATLLVVSFLSRPLGWTLLILWGAKVAWHAKDFCLCCQEFYAEIVSGAVTRDQQVHGHDDDQQNYSWSATQFQVSVAFGIIICLLAYLQIKSQTSLFKTAPLAMHSSLVLAAIAAISLFHLPLVILNGYYYQVLGYVSVISTSLWMVLLVFALSPPLAWGFLVVWGIFVAWYAKDFYLCCRDICAELVRAVTVSGDQGVHDEGDRV